MTRHLFAALWIFSCTVTVRAQGKIGYVDFQYILSQVQAAADVQSELQRLASEWTREIEEMQDTIGILEKDLETISLALSKSSRDALQKDISDRKQGVMTLREKRFSPVAGDLYRKQQELLQPVIDKIKKAIDNVRIRSKYDVLFDISAGNPVSIDKRFDLTVDVIDELPAVGLSVKKQIGSKTGEVQNQKSDLDDMSGSKGKGRVKSGVKESKNEESDQKKEDIEQ